MRMGTEAVRPVARRRVLQLAGLAAAWPWVAQAASPGRRFAAAWVRGGVHRVGWLALAADRRSVREVASLPVPTRAHGVALTPEGHLLAVARRPGDWLLRWPGPGQAPRWRWSEPLRAFNGHALLGPDGRHLYTTGSDLEGGGGLVAVHDARTLDLLDEWPTHGADPHQLVWDRLAPGQLIVANGGILTLPETGRAKHRLERMDSSLVRLDPARGGQRSGQWRLDDPRLSLRHLAWSLDGARLGIALQAEHDDPAQRAEAPVLAVFDGGAVRPVASPRALAGYGGDIACDRDGFTVSCTRADGLAHYAAQGEWRGFTPLNEAGALALAAGVQTLWAGGRDRVLGHTPAGGEAAWPIEDGGVRIDNHWVAV
jgi:hypothetical protein